MADESLQAQPPEAPPPPDTGAAPPESPESPESPEAPASLASPEPPEPLASPEPPESLASPELSSDDNLELEPEPPRETHGKSASDAAVPWVLAAVVVLLLAASAGLISAWVVATLRAVPAPALADVTPSPSPAASSAASASPSQEASDQPRHTPTPSPVATQEPPPFIHVVQRGEYLTYIADLYGVTVEEIVALNDITNPNRIRPGQELLIPGYGHQPSPSPGPG